MQLPVGEHGEVHERLRPFRAPAGPLAAPPGSRSARPGARPVRDARAGPGPPGRRGRCRDLRRRAAELPVRARLPVTLRVTFGAPQLDDAVRRLDGDRVLLGGSPRRLLTLSDKARGVLARADWDTPDRSRAGRQADRRPASPTPPRAAVPGSTRSASSSRSATASRSCATLLAGLDPALEVIVVDDGSQPPLAGSHHPPPDAAGTRRGPQRRDRRRDPPVRRRARLGRRRPGRVARRRCCRTSSIRGWRPSPLASSPPAEATRRARSPASSPATTRRAPRSISAPAPARVSARLAGVLRPGSGAACCAAARSASSHRSSTRACATARTST